MLLKFKLKFNKKIPYKFSLGCLLAVFFAILFTLVKRFSRVSPDTVIGVFASAAIALTERDGVTWHD